MATDILVKYHFFKSFCGKQNVTYKLHDFLAMKIFGVHSRNRENDKATREKEAKIFFFFFSD